ncbi:MAG TPA: BamA/TamA family outer membrane protein [Candidatus Megaira endosymbiont of Nemacystus decipiens]|nr:BamA/TamA family outer membrane protein [Candidatus Megaera endosymbiont of Nemacystus decipiens]
MTFNIKTNANSELKASLDKVSLDLRSSIKQLKTASQIDYWESEAESTFVKVLQSFGYYESLIEVIREEGKNSEEILLTFEINIGDRYRIKNVDIKFTSDGNKQIKNIPINKLKTRVGDYINASLVEKDEEKILDYIEKNNCLLSLSVSHQAIVDHLNDEVSITFLINAGPFATVEKIELTGLTSLKESYVKKLTGLKEGQCYKQTYIVDARSELQKSSLFLSSTPSVPENVNDKNEIPVTFDFKERKLRSIKFGINYDTDIGLNGVLGWQHRNLFGAGENVKVKLDSNITNQSFELNYQKPFFLRDDQLLRVENKYEHSKEKSFDTKEGNIGVFIDRKVSKYSKAGIGSQFSGIKEKKKNNKDNSQEFYLLSLPTYLEHDKRDNLLSSTKGYLARLDIEPFSSIKFNKSPFFKLKFTSSAYYSFSNQMTLAMRASTGSIFSKLDDSSIPLNERFLIGGSGSVRGYGHNLIGQSDIEGLVLGGRSFVELSNELRFKLRNNLGFVMFLDGGRTYNKKIAKINNLLFGAGFGLRYYTDFAPLRLDIAFPTKRRDSLDKSIQLYFGIGQSF